MGKDTFYITTPIYYPSAKLHIGHAYTTVYCDAIARWQRAKGREVFFLTGSDEHGLKIERAAKAQGKEPAEYVDEIVAGFKALWRRLNVQYDDFIRTSEPRHKKVVQAIFQRLYDQGDIYRDMYEGWYCTPCETFWPEGRLGEGRTCPDCGREVELVREESYFFRISRYAPRLLEHIEANPEFIQPATRRNEMVSFIRQGLEELCVSRTTFDWGIRVPFDEGHVIYVWIDALTNYLTGAGYMQDDAAFERRWPADLHVVGKDILRFHTIIWPCILMAAGLPLPKQVYGHGWLLVDSGKMSKSKGTVVDPHHLMDEFGVDAIRYYLLREVPYGQDAVYQRRALVERINADLANDLGNALHRSLSMLNKYFDGVVPAPETAEGFDLEVQELADRTRRAMDAQVTSLELNEALKTLWRFIGRLNKYIDESEPWALAKDPAKAGRLKTVMYHVLEGLRVTALLLAPFLPDTARKIWGQLGLGDELPPQSYEAAQWGGLPAGTQTRKGDPIFPRIDVEKALAEEDATMEERKAMESTASGPASDGAGAVSGAAAAKAAATNGTSGTAAGENGGAAPGEKPAGKPEITIDDFAKVDLRVAQILEAERIPGADKLLKLKVDLGTEQRQVVAGIAKHFAPEELVGRKIVMVANLKPVKLRGVLSQGMILAADGPDGGLGLVQVADDIPAGSGVH